MYEIGHLDADLHLLSYYIVQFRTPLEEGTTKLYKELELLYYG